jgi:hypothetical protein
VVTATVSIDVRPVNDAPVALDLTLQVSEDDPGTITLQADDVDGDAVTFTLVSGPSHGTASVSGDTATYTPAADYTGTDSFTYRATDPSGASGDATVSVIVEPDPLIGTRLYAPPILIRLDPTLRGTLTRADTGAPLPGRVLTFRTGSTVRCTAVTDATGTARCGPILNLAAVLSLGYDVTYDGDADFTAAAAHGPLLLTLFG